KTDLVMALAVVHHLAIGRNIPFSSIAKLFLQLGKTLIVEFIPREDEKVQFMLTQKKDIYQHYTETNFVQAFAGFYTIVKECAVGNSGRKLFLMKPHEY
ncbi:MAG TPA: hypothetical protein VFL47_09540, partial [Flavisolibacter sp.]|nr:hypothetical protein [Flavisolibacter sp.]